MTLRSVLGILLLGCMDVQYFHPDISPNLIGLPDGDLPLGVVHPKDVHQAVYSGLEACQTVVEVYGPTGRRIEGQAHMDLVSLQLLPALRLCRPSA